jgi:hypothetical protein
MGAILYDLAYYNNGANDGGGVMLNMNVLKADYSLIKGMTNIINGGGYSQNIIQSARMIRMRFQISTTIKSSFHYSYYFNK